MQKYYNRAIYIPVVFVCKHVEVTVRVSCERSESVINGQVDVFHFVENCLQHNDVGDLVILEQVDLVQDNICIRCV